MMKRHFTRSFLLALILLVGAEIVVRVFFTRNMSGRFDYGYHPTAGFVKKPDGTLELVRAGGRRFRPQSFKQQPDPGVFRVFVIGDSVPRGPSDDGAYAAQVGVMLRERGFNAESYNLAVAGYGAHRSQVVLKQALNYQPSLIVLHVNNSNEFEDEREWRRSREFQSWHPQNWLKKSLIIRRLYEAKTEKVFWDWLPTEVRNQGGVNDADAELKAGEDAATLQRWNERVRRLVAESVALCKERGVPVLLVSQAVMLKNPGGKARLEGDELLALVAPLQGDGVYLLPVKEVLADHDFEPLFADGSHLRTDGHKLIAGAIVRLIERESLAGRGAAK